MMGKKKTKAQVKTGDSMMMGIIKRLLTNKVAMLGLVILMIMIIACAFAPLIAPYSPTEMDYAFVFATPCKEHWFGCDNLGRDIFSRLLYGGRYSLAIGFIVSLIGMFLGCFFGTMVGYAGGQVDMVVMRFMDVWAAIPPTLLSIVVSAALGSGIGKTILAMTVGGIPGSVRGSRAMCLKEREMEYIESARSYNCNIFKLLYGQILPNIIAPTIVGTTMHIGSTISGVAALAYIGLGIQPPTPEWGAMLAAGREYILQYPHLLIFPGMMIALTVLSINLFGDGLRDAMDPRLKD